MQEACKQGSKHCRGDTCKGKTPQSMHADIRATLNAKPLHDASEGATAGAQVKPVKYSTHNCNT